MYIKQTHSTSTLLREQYTPDLPHLYTIRTDFQTAGRGQAGNSWESEQGKNLIFSALLRYPELHAAEQWRLSMLISVALWDTLAKHLPNDLLTIKWPNDIYYGDRKLVGILIENTLSGNRIAYTIAGIGVNVNQTQWLSNAPNPISMQQITGKTYKIETLLSDWILSMKSWEIAQTEDIRAAYMQHLYRRHGWHSYVEREVSVEPTNIVLSDSRQPIIDSRFLAEIATITEQGELVLRLQNKAEKIYHFKQIQFVL